jgi:hypothetical protein
LRGERAADLHKKSWNYARKVRPPFMNNPRDDRNVGSFWEPRASMKKIFRAQNVFIVFVVAFVAWHAEFAYRKNNACSPEDHRIQSEADAIAVVKKKIVKDRSFSSQQFGSADEFVDSLREVENCCSAKRSRNIVGVIVWRVYLEADASAKYNRRTVYVEMSNCGKISHDESYKDVGDRETSP